MDLFGIYNLLVLRCQLLFQAGNPRFQELDVTLLKLGNTLFIEVSLQDELASK